MILFFSGTGNSQLVAMRLAARLGDRLFAMDMRSMMSPSDVDSGERVVWVMPVHCWGVPKAVRRYLRSIDLPGAENSKHYLVATCGDDCGLMVEMWRKELRRRGWNAVAAHSVFMPNTYVTLPGFDVDPQTVASDKMAAMAERVDKIGHAIKCSSPIDSIHRGHFPWIKTRLLYPLFMAFLTSPGPFQIEGCIGCGKCVRACPLGNVVMGGDGYPQWGEQCTLCLGCYHVCPCHAVNYGRSTQRKGQWQGAFSAVSDAKHRGV